MTPELMTALEETFMLMLVGMGVVFLFLSVLIAAINLIAWVNRQFPEPQAPQQQPQREQSKQMSPAIVSAITAAIHQYRQRQ